MRRGKNFLRARTILPQGLGDAPRLKFSSCTNNFAARPGRCAAEKIFFAHEQFCRKAWAMLRGKNFRRARTILPPGPGDAPRKEVFFAHEQFCRKAWAMHRGKNFRRARTILPLGLGDAPRKKFTSCTNNFAARLGRCTAAKISSCANNFVARLR